MQVDLQATQRAVGMEPFMELSGRKLRPGTDATGASPILRYQVGRARSTDTSRAAEVTRAVLYSKRQLIRVRQQAVVADDSIREDHEAARRETPSALGLPGYSMQQRLPYGWQVWHLADRSTGAP